MACSTHTMILATIWRTTFPPPQYDLSSIITRKSKTRRNKTPPLPLRLCPHPASSKSGEKGKSQTQRMVPSADCIVQMQCLSAFSSSYLSRIAHSRRSNQGPAILTLCGPIFRSLRDNSHKRLRSKKIAPSALSFGNSCTPAVDPIRTRHNAAHQGLKLEKMSADDGRAPPHKKREIAEAAFLAER